MGEVCGSGWGEFARGCSLQALVIRRLDPLRFSFAATEAGDTSSKV